MRNRLVTAGGLWTGVGAAMAAASSAAVAGVIHDESMHGDLSDDRLNPTPLVLADGVNSLIATSQAGDREYVRFTVPAGRQLGAVNLTSYSGVDGTAFIAAQAGTSMTEPPTGTNVGNLLGWTHFGPGAGNLGDDILPAIGTGPGAIGFLPPLPEGEYTFWIQQIGSTSTYQLDFVSIPAPATLTLGVLALGAAARRRR